MKWMLSILLTIPWIGCVSTPETMHPEISAAIPEKWTNPQAMDTDVQSGWITSFQDEKLISLTTEAITQNPNLRATAARLEAAEADSRKAGAPLFPSLDFHATASKSQSLIRAAEGQPSDVDGLNRSRNTILSPTLNISWEADVWGRIRSGKAAAMADVQAAQADYDYARLSLAAQTAKSWFSAVEAKVQLDLARENLQSLKQTSDVVRDRFEKGLVEAFDVHLAQSDEASAEALVQLRLDELQRRMRELEVILGRYPGADLEIAEALSPVPPPIPTGIPSQILERRPDLRAAERRIASAVKRVSQAKAARLPKFSLSAGGGTSSDALRDIVDPKHDIWNLALNMVAPILDGGALKADVDRADAERKRVSAQYVETALNAFREVESALNSESLLAHRESSLLVAAEQADLAYTEARQRYSSGLQDLLSVLESQRRALQAHINLASVKQQRLANRVDLHLALGGDFIMDDTDAPSSKENSQDLLSANEPLSTLETHP